MRENMNNKEDKNQDIAIAVIQNQLETILKSQDTMHQNVNKILEQTTRHNGRMTKIETRELNYVTMQALGDILDNQRKEKRNAMYKIIGVMFSAIGLISFVFVGWFTGEVENIVDKRLASLRTVISSDVLTSLEEKYDITIE